MKCQLSSGPQGLHSNSRRHTEQQQGQGEGQPAQTGGGRDVGTQGGPGALHMFWTQSEGQNLKEASTNGPVSQETFPATSPASGATLLSTLPLLTLKY